MKSYIFFCSTINDVGGAQLYVRAKSAYLKEHGWNVKIVYYLGGSLLINEFSQYESIKIPEIHLPSYYFLGFIRNSVLRRIKKFTGKIDEESVIESHSLSLTTWAEYIAKDCKVKHLVYNIDETPRCRPEMFDYYKFKLDRNELCGILEQSISNFFEGFKVSLSEKQTFLRAYGASKSVLDVDYPVPFESKECYNIGFVGRLDKEYIHNTIDQVSLFLNKYKKSKFRLIFVGGERNGDSIKKELMLKYGNIPNVKTFFTGYIFPIPLSLVNTFDIAISGAGAAIQIKRCGIKTITIDPRDMQPNGVLGVTTNTTVFSLEKKCGDTLFELLEKVYLHPEEYKIDSVSDSIYEFDTHIERITQMSSDKQYNIDYEKNMSIMLFLKKILSIIYVVH